MHAQQNAVGATTALLTAAEKSPSVAVYTSSDHLLPLIPAMYQLAAAKRYDTCV